MSPIGRVFVVLNLVLAAVFVGFAGTYLQRATDWKEQFEQLEVASKAEIADLTGRLTASNTDLAAKEVQLQKSEANLANAEADGKGLRADNQDLQNRLSSIEGDVKSLNSSYATVAGNVQAATEKAEAYHKDAMAAATARDAAVREKEVAVADLRDALNRIAGLEGDVGTRDGLLAERDSEIRRQGIIIEIAKDRFGTEFIVNAQPHLGGTVQHVGPEGRLLTVTVTENPSSAELKRGYRFAIFSGDTYKAEAQVTEVNGNNAFCKVLDGKGIPILVGDRAVTNTY